MSQRKRDPWVSALDPYTWRLVAHTPVWVASKGTGSTGVMQLHNHKMQEDMDFCREVARVMGTEHADYMTPREVGEDVVSFKGKSLRFAAPKDGLTINERSYVAIDDVLDIPLLALLESGHKVFYTANRDYPFIVCRLIQVNLVTGNTGITPTKRGPLGPG